MEIKTFSKPLKSNQTLQLVAFTLKIHSTCISVIVSVSFQICKNIKQLKKQPQRALFVMTEGVNDCHHCNMNPCLLAAVEFRGMYILFFVAASRTNCVQDLKVKLFYFWLAHHRQ